VACLTIALAAVGNAFAQEDQSYDDQNKEETSQSDSDKNSEADKEQKQQQERQREQRQQQERQRQQQDRDRDQQSSERDQSWQNDQRTSQNRDQWPQPNGREYGSDSLSYREQQGRGEKQGGLGVGLRGDDGEGVIILHVHPGSPAQEMGIREGDRITAINGREVQSVQQFIGRISNMEPGEQIELDIRRARGGGDERTVRGELETRQQALGEHAERGGWQEDQFQQGRGNRQTSYEESRSGSSQRGTGQISGNRLEQIERQVDRLSREIDNLRSALQNVRSDSGSSGQSTQWNRERTARYDEYERTTDPRRNSQRGGQSGQRQMQSDRYESAGQSGQSDSNRTSGSNSDESNDSFDEGPGGEIGGDRQRVGSDDTRD
jgi:hypothetical protein